MPDPQQQMSHAEARKGRLPAHHHAPSYLERFQQPGDFTAFVLVLQTMTVKRLMVRADDAEQAAAIVRSGIDRAGRDARHYDVIMTVPGIVGQCTDAADSHWG